MRRFFIELGIVALLLTLLAILIVYGRIDSIKPQDIIGQEFTELFGIERTSITIPID